MTHTWHSRRFPRSDRRRLEVESLETRALLTAAIRGYVWNDWNRDGMRAKPDIEDRVGDITVNLLASDGHIVTSVQTDLEGVFDFSGLYPGNYSIEVVPLDDVEITEPDRGPDNKDSDADPSTGRTPLFSLRDGQTMETIDVGLTSRTGTSSLVGHVWQDTNGDGILTVDEPGIPHAEVQLENALGKRLYTVMTDDDGNYHIAGNHLLPGRYVLDFRRPEAGPSGVPWNISPPQASEDVDADRLSDPNVVNGKTPAFELRSAGAAGAPTLVQHQAGFYRGTQITGQVWHDVDLDGQHDEHEVGVGGVEAILLDANGKPISTSTSDGLGFFHFVVVPGEYRVEITRSPGHVFTTAHRGDIAFDSDVDEMTGRTPPLYVSQADQIVSLGVGVLASRGTPSLQGTIWHDRNANGWQDPDEEGLAGVAVELRNGQGMLLHQTRTRASGQYVIDGRDLLPGTYVLDMKRFDDRAQISPRNVSGESSSRFDSDIKPWNGRTPPFLLQPLESAPNSVTSMTFDGGFFLQATIDGRAFLDRDGTARGSESSLGVPLLPIDLLDEQQTVVASTVTDTRGYYSFADIQPGVAYQLRSVAPGDATFSPLHEAIYLGDNSIDPVTGLTRSFSPHSGESVSRWLGVRGREDSSSIHGTLWNDIDGDGVRSASEPGLANMMVRAMAENGQVTTTRSNNDGSYAFQGLQPSSYTVSVMLGNGTTYSPLHRGTQSDRDSDINRSTGHSRPIYALPGIGGAAVDVGIYSGDFAGSVADSLRITEVAFIGHGFPEFVEVKNVGNEPIDISQVAFVEGVRFSFADSPLKQLFPGEYAVIVGPEASLRDRVDVNEINIAGTYTGDLNRTETLTLAGPLFDTISSITYDDDWFVIMADEYQPWTLTTMDEHQDSSHYGEQSNWRPSSNQGGSPGFADPHTTPDPTSVIINEVMTKSLDGYNDLIELHNTTDQAIDISHWFVGDRSTTSDPDTFLRRYQIAPGTILGPHAFIVFSRENNFANPDDPGANDLFGLSSFGESVHLIAADAFGTIRGYSDSVNFAGSQIGVSFGREWLSDGSSILTAMKAPTFGRENSEPQTGPFVIDQIMADTSVGEDYIRLRYIGQQPWVASAASRLTLRGTIEYDFPTSGPPIAPGQFVFVTSSEPAHFRSRYELRDSVVVVGPYGGSLNPIANELTLYELSNSESGKLRQVVIDHIHAEKWINDTDVALVRRDNLVVGEEPTNWSLSLGDENTYLGHGDFLREAFPTSFGVDYDHNALGRVIVSLQAGDADGDGRFTSHDLVEVFQAGLYRQSLSATWFSGDWNDDGLFDESDLVAAFQQSEYESDLAASLAADDLLWFLDSPRRHLRNVS